MALATLTIDIDARMASLEKDMGRVASLVEQQAGRMTTAFKGAGVAAVGLLGGLSVAGLAAFVKGNAEAVDALNDVVDVTGSTIENISSLEQVAMLTGTTLDTVATSMVKFNQVLNAARPGSQTELDLKAIGLSVKALKDQDPADAIITFSQALAGFADDATKARLVQDLLGKSVREIGPYLKDLAEKGKLNAEVTSAQSLEAEKFLKHLAAIETRATNAARALANELLPSLNKLFERGSKGGFWAMLGFDDKFFETKKVGEAASELNRLTSLKQSFEEGLRADPSNRAYVQRLAEINEQLVTARANFKALYAQRASAPKEMMGPPAPAPAPPPIPEPGDAEALKKAAEDAKKAKEAYDKLTASIKEKVKTQEQEIALGRPLTDAESFYLQTSKQIEEQTEKLTPALKASAKAFLERQRAVILSNQAQIAGAAAAARNAQAYVNEADTSRKTSEQLMFELGLIGITSTKQQELTDARARDLDQRQLDRAEALLALANTDAERESLTSLTAALRAQISAREQISSTRTKAQTEPMQGAARAVDEYLEKVQQAGNATHDVVADSLGKLEDTLTDFATTGKAEVGDLVNYMIREFIRLQVIRPLMTGVFGGGESGGGTSLVGLIGSFFGGAFADGGDPPMGKVSLVGERGAELFVPKQAGTIVPNQVLRGLGGGGPSVSINQTLNVGGGVTRSELQAAMVLSKQQAKAEIYQSMRNRGAFS